MKSARKLLLLLVVLFPGGLAGDTFPSQERGFAPDKAFQVGDIDNVNLFSGNLVLSIPLGGRYPVGGGFSYGLSLVYNSNVWDFEEGVSGLSQPWPVSRSNAGMGWRVSLGRLESPLDPASSCGWCYVGPDGSEHIFYSTLHPDDPDDPGDSGSSQSVRYTRDGSYLRLRVTGQDWLVEFPDGQVHRFSPSLPYGRLTRIQDQFGNSLNIAYLTGAWRLTDSQGRVHWVRFATDYPEYEEVVTSVELAAFNGQPAAQYTFGYTIASIERPCPNNDPETANVPAVVPLLTSLTLPDGSRYAMALSDYQLVRPAAECRLSGVLEGLTLPTLGRMEWTYGGYSFPVDMAERPWRSSSAGVVSRTVKNAAGTVLGTWTYAPSLNPLPNQSTPAREAVRMVTTPLGDKTEHFFSVALDVGTTGWSRHDYGLPFSRFESAPESASRFRSSRVYDCDIAGANCQLRRTSWAGYERDTAGVTSGILQSDTALNRRVSTSQTTYHDDDNRYASVTLSDYDGLGCWGAVSSGRLTGKLHKRCAMTS